MREFVFCALLLATLSICIPIRLRKALLEAKEEDEDDDGDDGNSIKCLI